MSTKVLYVHTASAVWSQLIDEFLTMGWNAVGYCEMNTPQSVIHPTLMNVPTYTYEDALLGKPPEWLEAVAPLCHEILSYLEPFETMLLEIPSRFELKGKSLSYEERRDFLYRVVRVFCGLLDQLQPDMLIAASVPHRFVDNIWHLVCKFYGIKTLYLEHARVGKRKFVISCLEDRGRRFAIPPVEQDGVREDLVEFWNQQQASYEKAKPRYLSSGQRYLGRRSAVKNMVKQVMASYPTVLMLAELSNKFFKRRLFVRALAYSSKTPGALAWSTEWKYSVARMKLNKDILAAKKEYEKHCVEPDFDSPFVYFAPHSQPERSSCPDAGLYHDMAMLAETLAKSLPDDWSLYYKEHPSALRVPSAMGNPRSVDYYKGLLAHCKNIKFISIKEDPFRLIDSAVCTASATGTSILQSILRGKPALLFGDASFSYAPGVFRVKSLGECRDALARIVKNNQIAHCEIDNFLSAVDSFTGDYHFYYQDMVATRKKVNNSCVITSGHDNLLKELAQDFKAEFDQVYQSSSGFLEKEA